MYNFFHTFIEKALNASKYLDLERTINDRDEPDVLIAIDRYLVSN